MAAGTAQGQQVSGQLSAGYDFKMDQVKVGPFVTGQYTSVNVNSFTETGSLAPLSLAAQSEGYLSSDLGVSANRKWDLGGVTLSPSISAAWEHVYQGNLDTLNASLGAGGSFSVNGPATGTDAAVLGAGVNALLGKGFNVFVQYQGKLGLTNYTEQNFSGGVNIGF
jgi:outer membrane autotransporter protein